MRVLRRLPIWSKTAVIAVLLMLCLGIGVLVFAERQVRDSVYEQILARQAESIEIAATALKREMPSATIRRRDGRVVALTLAQWPHFAGSEMADHAFIDAIAAVTKDTSTIFAYDPRRDDFVRRTTNILKPDGSRAVGTYLTRDSAAYPAVAAGEAYLGAATILGTSYQTIYVPIMAASGELEANANGVAGILYVGIDDSVVQAEVAELRRALLAFAIPAMILAGLVLAAMLYILLRPLRRAAAQMRALADGERIAVTITRQDEIGEMQEALARLAEVSDRAFRQSDIVRQSDTALVSASAADGTIDGLNTAASDLIARLRENAPRLPRELSGAPMSALFPDPKKVAPLLTDPAKLPFVEQAALGKEMVRYKVTALSDADGAFAGPLLTLSLATQATRVADQFETEVATLLSKVSDALGTLRERTDQLQNAANQGQESSSSASGVASDVSEAVQTVASAVEQLNGSFVDVAERIRQSAEVTRNAATASEGAAETAKALEEAGQRISEVVELIADVAGQTNLLALNATIEASRAGEAGRGFAVVASEVKSLAGRAAKATSDISAEVERVRAAGGALLSAVANVRAAISKVDEVSGAVASAVEQQQVTAAEISHTIHQVAESAQRVKSLAQTVNESSGRTGQAASEVSALTVDLNSTGQMLRDQSTRFLEHCRNAA